MGICRRACLTGSIYGATSKSLFCACAWQQIRKICKWAQLKRELGCALKRTVRSPAPPAGSSQPSPVTFGSGKKTTNSSSRKKLKYKIGARVARTYRSPRKHCQMCVYPPVWQENPVVWSGSAMNTTISNTSQKQYRHTHTHKGGHITPTAVLRSGKAQRKTENTTTPPHWIICFLTFFFFFCAALLAAAALKRSN